MCVWVLCGWFVGLGCVASGVVVWLCVLLFLWCGVWPVVWGGVLFFFGVRVDCFTVLVGWIRLR